MTKKQKIKDHMIKNHMIKDQVIVITGSSSGAGRAAALEFAKYGNQLVLAARNETALNEVRAEVEELGSEALVVPTDTSDAKAMIALANAAIDWRDPIDVWINNAGVLAAGDFAPPHGRPRAGH